MDTDKLVDMAMTYDHLFYQQYFYQQYSYWQGVAQQSSILAPLPIVKAAPLPQIACRRGQSDNKDLQEKKHKRMLRNRESAARSRARNLAHIKELQNKVCRLEEENKSLMRQLQKLHLVEQQGTPQLGRANSSPL